VGSQRPGKPIEVLTIHTVFKPREGWRTRQGLLGSQRRTLTPQLKQGIATEAVGSIAVGIAGGNLLDLGNQVFCS
jgi:sensor histidine kinase regulating citrate/malate metabolism